MLEAKCPKCGYHCYGWTLTEPEHQPCPECGCKLEIYQEVGGGKQQTNEGREVIPTEQKTLTKG